MSEQTATAEGPGPAADEAEAGPIARYFGIDPASARRLAGSGYRTIERVGGLTPEELLKLGIPLEDIARIRSPPTPSDPPAPADPPKVPEDEDRIAERLMASVRPAPHRRRHKAAAAPAPSADILRRWIAGDDTAMEAWIRTPGGAKFPPPMESPKAAAVPATARASAAAPRGAAPPTTAAPSSPATAERERIVLRWLTELLDKMKSDQFDPASLLQELRDAQLRLYEERGRRAQLEDEVEQVKRGSVAVIKFVRSREAIAREQALRDKEAEIAALKLQLVAPGGGNGGAAAASAGRDREIESRVRDETSHQEEELRRRIAQLEAELREFKSGADTLRDRERLLEEKARELPAAVAEQLRALTVREKELASRENDLRVKFDEVRASSGEVDRQREFVKLKEKQLSEWEVELRGLKQTLENDARSIEQSHRDLKETGIPPDAARRLDQMKADLTRKEDELRNREMLLHQRIEELESRVSSAEADTVRGGVGADTGETRTPTGVRRLDDLLFGGLPKGAQVLLNGPPHTGKELLARMFIAEGLRRGIPAIWVVTDKTYTQVREEMMAILPAYHTLEQQGMVRYIDLYSRSLGVTQTEGGVRLLSTSDKGALELLSSSVNAYVQELKEKGNAYRLVVESVSTVTAYLDLTATFRFLQPFTGRRKLDGAAAYYLLETGMHTESDIETLEHMVDGSINFKIEQLKTFLSVRGITDVQSRAWVSYTFSKRAFSLGSFSLDHIR